MKMRRAFVAAPLLLLPALLMGQGKGLDPSDILQPLKDSWPTYNGDYTGKRYSALKQVDKTNVKDLTLAWFARVTAGATAPAGGGRGGGRGGAVIVGGEGTGDF